MKMFKICLYRHILLYFLILFVPAKGQNQELLNTTRRLESFVVNMNNFNRQYPQEKVYLHLDNTGYFMGETLWFKAYVLRADKNKLTDISSVLYVELVDPTGEIISTQKVKIKNGTASGYITLTDFLNSGFYEIRAYTRYMTNWDSGGIFSRVIPILNAPKQEGDYSDRTMDVFSYEKRLPNNRDEQVEEEERNMNVSFYPEGGHLVQGIENRVAFAITDENGIHFESTGWLEEDGKRIAEVSTFREGRGVFTCTPGRNRLTLHLLNKKGGERTFRLPKAETSGIVLRVDRADEGVFNISVGRSNSYAAIPLGIVAMHNGRIMRFEAIGDEPVSIDSQLLADGVNQIAVIDTLGNALAERMVFVYPRKNTAPIDIKMENEYLEPYGKIVLNIETEPMSAFSLAVRDYDTQVQGWQGDAWSWLLLTSDLKGYIENPRYYLEANDEEHQRAADLLMMVQGWRRYDMPQMDGARPFEIKNSPEHKGMTIQGQLHKKKRIPNEVNDVLLYMIYLNFKKDSCITDSMGRFSFDVMDFNGPTQLMFRPEKNGELPLYDYSFNRYFSPPTRFLYKSESLPIPVDAPRIRTGWRNDSLADNLIGKSHLLEMVEVKGKRRSMPISAYWSNERLGAKRASIFYDCQKESEKLREQMQKQPDFLKWLEKKNRFFSGSWGSDYTDDPLDLLKRSNTHKLIQTREGVDYKRRPVIWIIDNEFYCLTFAPRGISDHNISSTAVAWGEFPATLNEVKSVYISEDEQAWQKYLGLYKLEGYKPVTVFIYRRRNMADHLESLRKGLRAINFQGLQQVQTFKSPNYKIKPALPDHRRTLYWNPDVYTDSEGKAKVEFYNNTSCRQIAVSAEGVTRDGMVLLY